MDKLTAMNRCQYLRQGGVSCDNSRPFTPRFFASRYLFQFTSPKGQTLQYIALGSFAATGGWKLSKEKHIFASLLYVPFSYSSRCSTGLNSNTARISKCF